MSSGPRWSCRTTRRWPPSSTSEFKEFFPHNAVHYFVSYYDYYQPEAYIPQRDIYIEKDASINEEIDRLRLAATSALVSRRDVIIVASVSCIYGLGSPEDYRAMMVGLRVGPGRSTATRCSASWSTSSTSGTTSSFERGKFRVRGDCVEIWPVLRGVRLPDRVLGRRGRAALDHQSHQRRGDPARGASCSSIRPSTSCCPRSASQQAVDEIQQELDERLELFKSRASCWRPSGSAPGRGSTSRCCRRSATARASRTTAGRFRGRPPGAPPDTLFSFFPDDFLLFVDESHVTVPQVRGMYAGDHSRKMTLVEHGFRLPSALDNRPLRFDEWEKRIEQVIFVSATPGPYELEKTGGRGRRAGDPPHGAAGPGRSRSRRPAAQVPHLLEQIRQRAAAGERVLVTTLTKRLAEDLAAYFRKQDVRCKWLHSELDAFERVELLRDLRQGRFRRAGGRQPAARRAGPARGLAGGDPRRRQGRLPAERDVADADDRPLGPQRQRQGDSVCRQGDRLDAAGHRRDPPPPRDAGGVQPRARHHAGDDSQGDPRGHRVRGRGPCQVERGRGP